VRLVLYQQLILVLDEATDSPAHRLVTFVMYYLCNAVGCSGLLLLVANGVISETQIAVYGR